MKTSQLGLDLIKKYEGLRLIAYKATPSEKYYTIGYGHYGKDVTPNMSINQVQAEDILRSDIDFAEKAVNKLNLNLNQNQFDALVSFTYNCGPGTLRTLCRNRTLDQIADKIPAYNKAGGKVLNGLIKRRSDEQKLFKSEIQNEKKEELPAPKIEFKPKEDKSYHVKVSIKNLNIRKGPGTNYAKTGKFTGIGVFTIVDTQPGVGSKEGWGKLKSGGWISLHFCEVLK